MAALRLPRSSSLHVAARTRRPCCAPTLRSRFSTASSPAASRSQLTTMQTGFTSPTGTQLVAALSESGSDAVLGPLVVAAVVFDDQGAARLASEELPRGNDPDARKAFFDLTLKHAKAHKIIETPVNEINQLVTTKVNMAAKVTALKEKKVPEAVDIEDVVVVKMLQALKDIDLPPASDVAMFMGQEDKHLFGAADPRRKELTSVRMAVMRSKFPHLNIIGSKSHRDPWWLRAAYSLAKVTRDEKLAQTARVQRLELGTGYLHDWTTVNFLHSLVGRRPQHEHPIDVIRYKGWDRAILKDWRRVEEYRKHKEEYLREHPYMVNDPLRKTGAFEKLKEIIKKQPAGERRKAASS